MPVNSNSNGYVQNSLGTCVTYQFKINFKKKIIYESLPKCIAVAPSRYSCTRLTKEFTNFSYQIQNQGHNKEIKKKRKEKNRKETHVNTEIDVQLPESV